MTKFIFMIGLVLVLNNFIQAQNSFKAIVKDADSDEPLIGVNVFIPNTQTGAATDISGIVEIKNIPDGEHQITFSFIGYEEESLSLIFPSDAGNVFEIYLEPSAEELEEVSITSTRSSRLIDAEPTRVEVVTGEEIDEKIMMDPSTISMLLSESTGIQVQQTSASSVNNSFRIQGLEGRYTQLLKDGFPLYSGFSGSLSISQILPLDLKQVEIIKGSSSTLYGGGAIAGLINLVSKKPADKREISFLTNVTSASGLDLSGYYSEKFESTGISLFAARNTQRVYDNNNDNFSDLPQIERYTVNPKIYFYFDDGSTLNLGLTGMTEKRKGGSITQIKNEPDSVFTYTEENNSERISAQFQFDKKLSGKSALTLKTSGVYFDRGILLPGYMFKGNQYSVFSELSFVSGDEHTDWAMGLNFLLDEFNDKSINAFNRNYTDFTLGAFIQNTVDLSELLSVESGLRTDYDKHHGWFVLPRLSVLARWTDNLTSRIGGGLGYKTPNIFTEAAEMVFFKNVLPVDNKIVKPERSHGLNFDLNFNSILFDQVTISINQLFFYTRINDPSVLSTTETLPLQYEYLTLPGHYDSRGTETNLKLTYDHFKLFAGYTYTDVRVHTGDLLTEFILTPKHKLGLILFYEVHGDLRIGLEGYYTGTQKLSSGQRSKSYWVTGFMVSKQLGNVNLFINFENFLDERQSRYGAMFTGTGSNPVFNEIYAPTDGRIINGGFKINL